MKARDVFGVIVRTAGLSLTIYALWYLAYGIAMMAGLPEEEQGNRPGYFLTGFLFLVMGLYFLRGAPGIMGFAYPAAGTRAEAKSESPADPSAGKPHT